MLTDFLLIFSALAFLLIILGLLFLKAGLQLQAYRLERGLPKGEVLDFLNFDLSDPAERKQRWEAFMLFPLLYPVVPEDSDSEELRLIKRRVKSIHIAMYSLLILLVLVAFYSSKSDELPV